MDVDADADAEADAEAPPDAEAHADTNDAGVDAAEPLAASEGFAEEDEEEGAEVDAAGAAAADDDDEVEEEEVEGAFTTCFPAVVSMVMIASLTLLHIPAVGASMLSDLPGAAP